MASLVTKLLTRSPKIHLNLTSRLNIRHGVSRHLRVNSNHVGRRFYSASMTDRIVTEDPVVVPSPSPNVVIPETNLAEYTLTSFSQYGDRVALVDGTTGVETTFNQLTTKITRVASAFVKAGLKKGDVVTIFSPNCPEFAITYLAIASMGGVVSAVNPVYTSGELHHAIAHAGTKFVVTVPALMPVTKEAVKNCPDLKGVIVFGESEGYRPFQSLLDDDGSAFPENLDFNPKDDLVALPYSSGTTGLPKGVMLTHHNIVANIEQISNKDVLAYSTDDSLIGVLPFFHIYGQVVVLLSGLFQGTKITSLAKFEPELFLRTISEQRATFLHVVPPIILFLAQHPIIDKYDLSSLHTFFTGAAPVGPKVIEQAVQRFSGQVSFRQVVGATTFIGWATGGMGCVVMLFPDSADLERYGLTESSPVSHCNPPVGFQYSSIGPPVPNTESKVVDVTTGKTLGYGHEGEVWVRGPQVMKGYFKNEKATAETVDEDGWLHTGDIGYCQPDSHFYITDRLKELIKVKGLQVAPAELEALLLQHPSIQDTAVIGIEDERSGEVPRAYVVLKADAQPDSDSIYKFIEERVAPFKKLDGGIEFIQEIPKSASGKILRRFLRDDYKEKNPS